MKSTKTNLPIKPEIQFPCLMIEQPSGIVVLMLQRNMGTVVHNTGDSTDVSIGYYITNWYMPDFIPYIGQIILSND